ncbi:CaiB/BaiF CoA transferase family protein [Marinovum sp.]|uniref:CaiB/BaiF CoA transferase family protein n=1 Tax=Marinovum sp. TaxID=2024839 RepID=UPI003A8DF0C1
MSTPLSNIRVIDMTRVVAGPLSTQILGDLGADIVKIERPVTGDDSRQVGPPWMKDPDGNETAQSTYYQSVNRNKRSVAVNFADPEGAEIIRELIKDADVFVENFRPGTLDKYGLGYEQLKALNPRLIYCSVTGFGQTGPYSDRSGYDYLAQAMAGVLSVTGHPDDQPNGGPVRVGVPLADILAGQQAAIGVLAALQSRVTSGRGQWLDVSLFGSQFAAMANPLSAWVNAGKLIGRTGNDHPSAAPYGIYEVEDGFVLIATFNDREFGRLAEALGHPEWITDPRFARNGDRVNNRSALKAAVRDALQGRTRAELIESLNRAKVSCGPINTLADLEQDPHVQSTGMIVATEHPKLGTLRGAALPVRFSEDSPSYRLAPPEVGEHTDEVLTRDMGYAPDRLAELRRKGVL